MVSPPRLHMLHGVLTWSPMLGNTNTSNNNSKVSHNNRGSSSLLGGHFAPVSLAICGPSPSENYSTRNTILWKLVVVVIAASKPKKRHRRYLRSATRSLTKRRGRVGTAKAKEWLQTVSDEVAEHCNRNFTLKLRNLKRKLLSSKSKFRT